MRRRIWMIAALAPAVAGCAGAQTKWDEWVASTKQTSGDTRTDAQRRSDEAKPEPPPTILPATYIAAGRMLESNGDFAGALVQYDRAIGVDPNCVEAYSRLGVAWQRLGKYAEAEKVLQKGLAIQPNAAFLHNNLGYCYMMQKQNEKALGEFESALSLNPEFKRARMNRAMAMGRMGRTSESLAEFQRVLTPDSANYNVGVICMQLNRNVEAKRYFIQALTINPACPGARESLNRLQQWSTPVTAERPIPERTGPATYTLTADGLQQTMATPNDDAGALP